MELHGIQPAIDPERLWKTALLFDTDGCDPGQSCQSFVQLGEDKARRFPVREVFPWQVNVNAQQILRIEPRIDSKQACDVLDHQSRPCQQQQSQGNLRHHQPATVAAPGDANRRASPGLLQGICQAGSCRPNSRRHTEDQSCRDGNKQSET